MIGTRRPPHPHAQQIPPPRRRPWNPEYFGATVVVNDKAWPYLRVRRIRYRFRILYASNARFFRLHAVEDRVALHTPAPRRRCLPPPLPHSDSCAATARPPRGTPASAIRMDQARPFHFISASLTVASFSSFRIFHPPLRRRRKRFAADFAWFLKGSAVPSTVASFAPSPEKNQRCRSVVSGWDGFGTGSTEGVYNLFKSSRKLSYRCERILDRKCRLHNGQTF